MTAPDIEPTAFMDGEPLENILGLIGFNEEQFEQITRKLIYQIESDFISCERSFINHYS